ncbi:hypothetical protein ES705_33019 [subsurface metagenome]
MHTVDVEGIPLCAIVRRLTKDDYRGKLEYEKENYQAAENLLQSAGKIDPGNEINWINLGKTYLKQERYPEARDAFGKCLKILPDYEPALYYLADMELALGNKNQAEELFRNIISVNSKSFRAYIAYAGIKAKSAEYSDAIEILDRCLDLNPRYKDAITMKEELLDRL